MKRLHYITAMVITATLPLATPSPVHAQYLYENDYYSGDVYEEYGWVSNWNENEYPDAYVDDVNTLNGPSTGALDDDDDDVDYVEGVTDDDDRIIEDGDDIGDDDGVLEDDDGAIEDDYSAPGREDVINPGRVNNDVGIQDSYDSTNFYGDSYSYDYEEDWTGDTEWGIEDDDWWE